jgi:hypothetical protein
VFAQTGLGFYGIGGGIGFVFPEAGIGTTFGIWARAAVGSFFMPNLFFHGDVLFWSKGEDETYWEWKWSAFSIMPMATYVFGDLSAPFRPYAGAGLGIVISRIKSEYTGPSTWLPKANPMSPMAAEVYSSTASGTDLGIRFIGGFEYDLTDALTLVAEGDYHIGGIDHATIRGGVRYNLDL